MRIDTSSAASSSRLLVFALAFLISLVAAVHLGAPGAYAQGKSQSAPGQAKKPSTPPGQAKKPSTPPGQANRPSTPPGQANRPSTTPPPGQANRPSTPPGQAHRPATPPPAPPAQPQGPTNPNAGPGNNSGNGNTNPGTPQGNRDGKADRRRGNGNGGNQRRAENQRGRGRERLTLCHATNSATNPFREITVAGPALRAHLRQGGLYPVPADGCPAGTRDRDKPERVTLCHATNSATNPYVVITIASPALPAHLRQGGIYPVPADGCPGLGDENEVGDEDGGSPELFRVCVPSDGEPAYEIIELRAGELPDELGRGGGGIYPVPADGCPRLVTLAAGGAGGPGGSEEPTLAAAATGDGDGAAGETTDADVARLAVAPGGDADRDGGAGALPFTGLGLLALLLLGATLTAGGLKLRRSSGTE